jgi:RNA polymerase sigma-70 factor (ECF subfamily)
MGLGLVRNERVGDSLGERHERADDLLQEIWLGVFRALPKLNDAAAFRAWLFRIARAQACREFRQVRMDSLDAYEESQIEEATAEGESTVDVEAVQQQLAGLSPTPPTARVHP